MSATKPESTQHPQEVPRRELAGKLSQVPDEHLGKVLELVARLAGSHSPVQRVATAEGAEGLISEGWAFVEVLPNGRVVLEDQSCT